MRSGFYTSVMAVLVCECLITLSTQAEQTVALHHRVFDSDCHHTMMPVTGHCWLAAPGLFYARLLEELPLANTAWPAIPPTPPAYRPITSPQPPIIIPLPPPPTIPKPPLKPDASAAAALEPVPPEAMPPEPVQPSPIEPEPTTIAPETQTPRRPPQRQFSRAPLASIATAWLDEEGYSELIVVTPDSATQSPDSSSVFTLDAPTVDRHMMRLEWHDLASHFPEMGQLTQSRNLTLVCACGDRLIHFTGDATFTFDLETWEGALDNIMLQGDGGQSANGKLTFWVEELYPALFSDHQAALSLVIDQAATEWSADLVFGLFLPEPTPPLDAALAARGLFTASEFERLWGLIGYFDSDCEAPGSPCGTEN